MSRNKSKYLRLIEDHSVTKVKYKNKILYLYINIYNFSKLISIYPLDKKDCCVYEGGTEDNAALRLVIEEFYMRS